MKEKGVYPSKVMLVGEYGVVIGGSALTVPFRRYRATVRSVKEIPPEKEEEAKESIHYLNKLYRYILEQPQEEFHASPNMERFRDQLGDHWLEMSIPVGYGLGSSGAVSAAVYDLFFPGSRTHSLLLQKKDLARIESFFHGQSSGVDALTCFIDTPLYFQPGGSIRKIALDPASLPGGYRLFLLDSGQRLDTGPLVREFLEWMKDPGFATFMKNEYLVANQKLIEILMGEKEGDPGLLFRILSDYQFNRFRKMIPANMIDLWLEGQISNEYYLKLNGSGGGFMLGITHLTSGEALAERWKEKIIWIE
jgi:mevalonate kinase